MNNISMEGARHSSQKANADEKSQFRNEKPTEDVESQLSSQTSADSATVSGEKTPKESLNFSLTDDETKSSDKRNLKDCNDPEKRNNVTQSVVVEKESEKTSSADNIAENELQSKSPTDDLDSPSASDDKPGRRKRKPSRFHDSMFDIPTNLMNINRTINPEEFRAFHSKSLKTKEKPKKLLPIAEGETIEKTNIEDQDSPKPSVISQPEPSRPSYDDDTYGDDVLDAFNMFKFKMRKDHVIHSTVGGATIYRCDICMMTFPRSFSLRRHYTRRHVNPRYVLPKAGSINVTENENPEWIASLPVPMENPNDSIESKYLYYCKMCSKDYLYFEHKDQLRNHCLETHSSLPKRPVSIFKCEICKRSYSTKHELDRHKRTHSGERPYSCGFCGKTFPTSTNARRHERTHTGDKPYICKVCNKDFAQKSDMVKHLRSTHKMKVTKTKAERTDHVKKPKNDGDSGSKTLGFYNISRGESGRIRQSDEFKGIGNNEFQENIDFAAYLRLDQHDSGTLMGEKRQLRTALSANPNPENQQNNSNNHLTNSAPTSKDLKDTVPSELLIGVDGKPEKWHRCPNCSKMFTSNINLRRHHKLKHERNQLYQCAEPVSMVVEKYKIKNDATVQLKTSFEDTTASPTEKPTSDKITTLNPSENTETFNEDKNALKGSLKMQVTTTKASPSLIYSKKRNKGINSRLSNIVQRLAHKRSAEQPVLAKQMAGDTMSPPDLQPIIKLEEMENQMFRDYFSSDSNSNSSPQRKRRKPNNVQHVETVPSFDEKLQSCIEEDSNKKSQIEKYHARPNRQQMMENISGPSKIPNLISDSRNQHNQTPSGHERRTPKLFFRNMYHQDRTNINRKQNFQESTSQFMSNEYHHQPVHPIMPNRFTNTDISKSFAPLTSKPFPLQHGCEFISSPQTHESGDPERIKTFLSQCWSSRRHDIPQNAILDKSMPVRDTNAMNRKLKYNMRHMPSERINEHLPPSAYFSQRDPLSSGFNPMKRQKIFPSNFARMAEIRTPKHHEISEKISALKNDTKIGESDTDDHPLDLRIQSKKTIPDYVVRDDGVLDFSRKSKDSFIKPKISPKMSSDRPHTHIKGEYGKDIPSYRETSMMSPPYRNMSHGDWMDHPSNTPPMELNSYPINEHRRAKLHGRNHPESQRRPFKFHSVNFEPPRPHPPHPDYVMMGSRKPMPPPLKPFREHPYISSPPQRITSPNRYPMTGSSPGISPNFQIPKQKMHLYHAQERSHKQREFNFPLDPSCSECHAGMMHASHQQIPDYGRRNRLPIHSAHQKQNEKILHQSKTRPILPKARDYNIKEHVTHMQEQKHKSQAAYSDQDMMNRCIRKAQQALKVETLTGTDKTDNKEMMVYPHSEAPKTGSDKESEVIKNNVEAVSPLNGETSKILKLQLSSNLSVLNKGKIHMLDPTKASAIGLPPPLFPDYNKDTKRILEETELCSQDNTSYPRDTRHNLTMTPELDYAQDDSTESDKVLLERSTVDEVKSDDENQLIEENLKGLKDEEPLIKLEKPDTATKETQPTTFTETEKINNMLNQSTSQKSPTFLNNSPHRTDAALKKKTPSNPCDGTESDQKVDGSENITTTESSVKQQPESLTSESIKIIPHRRHTHLPPETESDIGKTNWESLKRSLSNDSLQTPDSNDESELARKTIKKLKLRVVKSPGSEKKKCWTLVKQERPLTVQHDEGIQNLSIKSTGTLPQDTAETASTESKTTLKSEDIDETKLPSKRINEKFKDKTEISKKKKQEVDAGREDQEIETTKLRAKSQVEEEKSEENKETMLSMVTNERIENALSAVIIPVVDCISQFHKSDDMLKNETDVNGEHNDIDRSEAVCEDIPEDESQVAVQVVKDKVNKNCETSKVADLDTLAKDTTTQHPNLSKEKVKTTIIGGNHTKKEIKKNTDSESKILKTIGKKSVKRTTEKKSTSVADDLNDNIFSRLYRVNLEDSTIIQAEQVCEKIIESTTNEVANYPTGSEAIPETSDVKGRKNSHKTRSATITAKSPEKKNTGAKKNVAAATTVGANQLPRRSCRIRKSSSDKDKAVKKKK